MISAASCITAVTFISEPHLKMDKHWTSFHKLSGYLTIFQFAILIAFTVFGAMYGPRPANVIEYFSLTETSIIKNVLVSDLLILLMLSVYLISLTNF